MSEFLEDFNVTDKERQEAHIAYEVLRALAATFSPHAAMNGAVLLMSELMSLVEGGEDKRTSLCAELERAIRQNANELAQARASKNKKQEA